MKKYSVVISFLCLFSLFFNVIFIIKKNNNENANETANVKINNFNYVISDIINNFEIDGYVEILTEYNHMLAVPINANDPDIMNRQKFFIFKNQGKETIILFNVSYSKQDNIIDEWHSSFDYSSDYFNSKDGKFSGSYYSKYPDVQIACNSFNNFGCHFEVIAFSKNDIKDIAAAEVIAFTNKLINFLENEGSMQ